MSIHSPYSTGDTLPSDTNKEGSQNPTRPLPTSTAHQRHAKHTYQQQTHWRQHTGINHHLSDTHTTQPGRDTGSQHPTNDTRATSILPAISFLSLSLSQTLPITKKFTFQLWCAITKTTLYSYKLNTTELPPHTHTYTVTRTNMHPLNSGWAKTGAMGCGYSQNQSRRRVPTSLPSITEPAIKSTFSNRLGCYSKGTQIIHPWFV